MTTTDAQPTRSLSPVLRLSPAARAIEFYRSAFGARERYRLTDPGTQRIAHAELILGDGILMLSEEPDQPASGGARPAVQLSLGVANVDQTVSRAMEAGATLLRPPADHFYGYRCANLRDPFGFEWMISQLLEPLSPEEMQQRWNSIRSASGSKPA